MVDCGVAVAVWKASSTSIGVSGVSIEVEDVVEGSRDIEGVEDADGGEDIGWGSVGEEENENKR
jgi:hypothetical protein